MTKKCSNCRLVNYSEADKCVRCEAELDPLVTTATVKPSPSVPIRIAVCLVVCLATIAGFYLSLIVSSKPLAAEQKQTVKRAVDLIRERGFLSEADLLDSFAAYRGTDNWLNSLVPKENAYAATNYPFGILTLYPEFFTYPIDDTERAAILLHEAVHLRGGDEKDAYQFVWVNRQKLGWVKQTHFKSQLWRNVRLQTREYAPALFVCEGGEANDCTE